MKYFIRLILIIALFLEGCSFVFKLLGAIGAIGFVYFSVFISLFILVFCLIGLSVLLIKEKFRAEILQDLKREIVLFVFAICMMILVGITGWV